MKWLQIVLLSLLSFPALAQTTYGPISGFCVNGAKPAMTSGLPSSNYNQNLIPLCTVKVFLTGTTTPATIFADKNGTSLGNPFTANGDGSWTYYVALAPGQGYDTTLSGGIAPNVYTTPRTLVGQFPSTNLTAAGSTWQIQINAGGIFGTMPLAWTDSAGDFAQGITGTFTPNQNLPNSAGYLKQVVQKLTEVNIEHPDFAASCPNAADPTFQQNSLCAIQAALAYACSGPSLTGQLNTVVVPAGKFAVNGTITVPCPLRIRGEMWNASQLVETNTSGAPLLIFTNSASGGWMVDHIQLAGLGHTTTGTLLSAISAPIGTIESVHFYNGGGIGLLMTGSSERINITNSIWDWMNRPITLLGNTNEDHFIDNKVTLIGEDTGGYIYNLNAPNGVWPAANTGPNCSTYANTYATMQTNGWVKGGQLLCDGTNVEQAQYDFAPGASPPTWNASVGGFTTDGTNTNAWINKGASPTLILPDDMPSVSFSGVNNLWKASSIKALNYRSGIFAEGGSVILDNIYFESATASDNHAVETYVADIFTLSGNSTATYMPLTSTSRMLAFVDLASTYVGNGQGNGGCYITYPGDFTPNSSVQSATASAGVTQGMWEITCGAGGNDNNFYFFNPGGRNQSGSAAGLPTAPTWFAGSHMILYEGNVHSDIPFYMVHSSPVANPNWPSGYVGDCNDWDREPCADLVEGPWAINPAFAGSNIFNKITEGGTRPKSNSQSFFDLEGPQDFFYGIPPNGGAFGYPSTAEWQGQGWAKGPRGGSVLATLPVATNPQTNGSLNVPPYPGRYAMFLGFTPGFAMPVAFGSYGANFATLSNASMYGPNYVLGSTGTQYGPLQEYQGTDRFNNGGTGFQYVHFYSDQSCPLSDTNWTNGHGMAFCGYGLPNFPNGGIYLGAANATANTIAKVWNLQIAGENTANPTVNATHAGNYTLSANGIFSMDGGVTFTNQYNFSLDTGVANAYVLTPNPPWTSYPTGYTMHFTPLNNNTGASTVNVSGLGVKSILKNGGTALAAGDLLATTMAEINYDGTRFQLQNPQSVPASQLIPIRAGTWTITSPSSTFNVTFSPAMTATPTSCQVTGSASMAATGVPFATALATSGFTVNVPTAPSGSLSGTYLCGINNSN